jgi:DNA polymerase III sliding clamp (beta) subunit (PCNA family)
MDRNIQSLEFIHKDSYGTALEVARKFVNKGETRPILNYVFHAANGDMIATDSHRLIHIKDMHGFEKDYLINPNHYMVAKGKFPDTEKLIQRTDQYKGMVVLTKEQIRLWLQLFKSINQTLKVLKDRGKIVSMSFPDTSEEVDISMKHHGIKISLPCTRPIDEKQERITFSAEYMRDALEAHSKLNSETLTIWLASPFQQMILDDDYLVKTLILPVRTY